MFDEVDDLTLRPFKPEDASKMVELQRRCLEESRDTSLLPEGFYFSPGFAGGDNILCAVDSAGTLVGHAMVYPSHVHPQLGVWMLWLDLRVDPDYAPADQLRDRLLERIQVRAREIQAGLDRRAMLYATYLSEGGASLAYLRSRGFELVERIYQMQRDLSKPVPDYPQPEGAEVRDWRMETEEEQRRYLEAYDASFENESKPLERLQHFMGWSAWAPGTTFTAFVDDRVVGSVMVYYEPDLEQNEERVGYTEYVFVRPGWRRQGLARHLVTRGLHFLKERGLAYARLEVAAHNEGAVGLYRSLGYERLHEEITLGLRLDDPVGAGGNV